MLVPKDGYKDHSDYTTALDYEYKALKIREEENNSEGLALSYNNMGVLQMNLGLYDDALLSFTKSIKLYKTLNNNNGTALCLGNIANIYHYKKKYNEALKYYEQALSLATSLNDRVQCAWL